jgi:hypothetical protein
VQIVIYGHARTQAKVQWTLSHTRRGGRGHREARADEPELPL